MTIVDLDVPRAEFSQMLKQLWSMAVLGVDQQVVFTGQRFARPGINGLRPEHYWRLIGWTMFGDQVAIPLTVAEHCPKIGGIMVWTWASISPYLSVCPPALMICVSARRTPF
jgi:hypothetical protein